MVLITGASQGIGAEIARVFATEMKGVRLALVARSEAGLRKVAAACAKRGAVVETFPCDVSDAAAVATTGAAVTKRFKAVDVLINNAGKFAPSEFLALSVEDFDAFASQLGVDPKEAMAQAEAMAANPEAMGMMERMQQNPRVMEAVMDIAMNG